MPDFDYSKFAKPLGADVPNVLAPRVKAPRDYHDLSDFARSQNFTVTSTTGGTHNPGSKHYQGLAVDVRTRDKTPEEIDALMSAARGSGIRVLDERTPPKRPGQVWSGQHLHLEAGGVPLAAPQPASEFDYSKFAKP